MFVGHKIKGGVLRWGAINPTNRLALLVVNNVAAEIGLSVPSALLQVSLHHFFDCRLGFLSTRPLQPSLRTNTTTTTATAAASMASFKIVATCKTALNTSDTSTNAQANTAAAGELPVAGVSTARLVLSTLSVPRGAVKLREGQ